MTVFSHSDIVDGAISKNRSPPYLLKVNLEKQSTSVSHTGLFGFFPQTLALNILFEKLILRCDNQNFHLLSSDSISFTFITKDSTVKLSIIFYSHIHSYTILSSTHSFMFLHNYLKYTLLNTTLSMTQSMLL